MKLTLEPQEVYRATRDQSFPQLRLWKGVTDDGRPVVALIADVVPCRPEDQPFFEVALNLAPKAKAA